jgi:hypothetical protein
MCDAAREIEGGGIVSNISADPDVIAGVFAAIEELEHLGRDKTNMYMSLVIALPHELQDRETLLAGICKPFERLGVPCAAALHRPGKDGDQRSMSTASAINAVEPAITPAANSATNIRALITNTIWRTRRWSACRASRSSALPLDAQQ